MEVILAIDIGTSSIKVAIINLKGQLVKKFSNHLSYSLLKT